MNIETNFKIDIKMKILFNQHNMKIQLLAIIFIFAASGLKAQQSVNFTGTWLRSTEECDTSQISIHSIPISISVEQNKSQIQIHRIAQTENGDSTAYTENIKFDGSSATSLVKTNLHKSASITWSADHKQLTEIANYEDNQGNATHKLKESWSLSVDSKRLTTHIIMIINGKDYESTAVFRRK
jgi:hypothetical protein